MATTAPIVNTKAAPRRALQLHSWDQLIAEVDRVQAGVQAGAATHTGNWSIGQNAEHCGNFMRCALDGFSFRAPAPVRFIMRAIFLPQAMGSKPIPPGFKLPSRAADLLPSDGISDHDGLAVLRRQAQRVADGERFTHPSPIFGKLTHEQWTTIHLKHVALHFGFIEPEGSPARG